MHAAHPRETIADVVERSGGQPREPFDWLELVALTLWEESPHRHAFDAAADDAIALYKQNRSDARLDNTRVFEVCQAISYAVRVGYGLGLLQGLPACEQLAYARALADE